MGLGTRLEGLIDFGGWFSTDADISFRFTPNGHWLGWVWD